MTTKLQTENLTKVFGRPSKQVWRMLKEGVAKDEILKRTGCTVGVNNVSFKVNKGEVFVIMGLSGSGKSTLIRCLNLLTKPTAGKVFVDGENILEYSREELRRLRQNKMAMVFQHFGLFTHMSVQNNVEYGLAVKGIPREEREKKAQQALEAVGLGGWQDMLPGQLSGGMQQRVGLARALANDPDILLMDEPFSSLDPLIRRDMQMELLELQDRLQKTIVFITHDINEAFKMGDRVAVMKDGIIEQTGTPEEILANPASDYIRDFVQDVDRSRVLQAKDIMFTPDALLSRKSGLKMAIREMQLHGISSVFVIGSGRKLLGLITIDDAVSALKDNKTVDDILKDDYFTTGPEIYVNELIPLAKDTRYPIAVVDENERLLGIIVRASVISAFVG
ncbi:MAG: glycine betaine/L-proline ABC transporter ATP-binding protein [Dethiobacteria bacterium]|nr:glycine betaine/L-proline ABC transporter ATP-binding protein [Bacillota bacterium]NMD33399.1 glycine betaine/L-proline ABC transporter ATP-binding protein [Bacillota bacterium]HOB29693.1 glycine betaine/L-proline ABC transporter ATP-binding protein [Bacillota bacterium]